MSSGSLERILVATDLSQLASGALGWAALFQRRLGGRITVLYANPPWVPFDIVEGPAAYALQTSQAFRDGLSRDFREYIERHLPTSGDAVETRIVNLSPAQAILETAAEIDAELVVIGTHGRTGWRRALLGSVAENVVHHIDRTVLCIPGGAPPSIGTILCPVDFTGVARVALEEACSLAATFDAELLIVHVTDPEDEGSDIEGELAAWIDPEVRTRCRYVHLVASGNAAEQTIRLAHEAHAELIVLGTRHRRFADASVIGETTERVIRYSKKPVWAVHVPESRRGA